MEIETIETACLIRVGAFQTLQIETIEIVSET